MGSMVHPDIVQVIKTELSPSLASASQMPYTV